MLYRVETWAPCTHESGWERQGIVQIVGTLAAAKRIASSFLAPHAASASWYGYQRGRFHFVEIQHIKAKKVVAKTQLDASVTIVPSVGELGYTP